MNAPGSGELTGRKDEKASHKANDELQYRILQRALGLRWMTSVQQRLVQEKRRGRIIIVINAYRYRSLSSD
jgi:hypothetical protein